MTSLSTAFSPQQQRVIASEHENILVLATAGSGKTRTLVGRTNALRDSGVDPRQMCVITFTNAAANELQERAGCHFGYCGTLHSFMLRLLQRHGDRIGLYGPLSVIDEDGADRLLQEVIDETGYRGTKAALQAAIERGPAGLQGDASRPAVVALGYYQAMRRAQALDFDAILHYGLTLAVDVRCLPDAEFGFTHLFVDEYQDSAAIDAQIYAALPFAHRFFVGDANQSIYGFRGAYVGNIIFLASAAGTELLELSDNYRCDEAICDAAQQLIKHNCGRLETSPRSATGGVGEVNVRGFDDERDELVALAQAINALDNPDEVAVLVRTNALVDFFRERLEGFGVPVQRNENVRLPPDWKRVRQYVALLCNPENDRLAYWWLKETQGAAAADKAKGEALDAFSSINDVALKLHGDMATIPRDLGRAGIAAETIRKVDSIMEALPPDATIAELALALGQQYGDRRPGGRGVSVLTVHGAKGREWDTVFLPAFEQGNMPSLSQSTTIDEERRIAFVAFTRARHRLEISYSAARTDPYRRVTVAVERSQFIGEALSTAAVDLADADRFRDELDDQRAEEAEAGDEREEFSVRYDRS